MIKLLLPSLTTAPLVSVICLCYNHERFVTEALQSVLEQTYKNIELIIIDDCSQDQSATVIETFTASHPAVTFIRNKTNIGNCRSFNHGLKISRGQYVIDFAADDVMMPERIEKQVKAFLSMDPSYGVVFSNALNIDEEGKIISVHHTQGMEVPSGNIYKEVLKRYFISPPTMMMSRKVLEELGGYDESLAYEDFDFWIRSSRNFRYFYLDEILTKKRAVRGSHSSGFYRKGQPHMFLSTLKVIQKALWLNQDAEENKFLTGRIRYEMRHAFYIQEREMVKRYAELLTDLKGRDFLSDMIVKLSGWKVPAYRFYLWYRRFIK